jgi:hypothetical protein
MNLYEKDTHWYLAHEKLAVQLLSSKSILLSLLEKDFTNNYRGFGITQTNRYLITLWILRILNYPQNTLWILPPSHTIS